MNLGDLTHALKYAQKSVELSDRSGHALMRLVSRAISGFVLHQKGSLLEAAAKFREAERLQKTMQPDYPLLRSNHGFSYSDLLLDQNKYFEVQNRAKKVIGWLTSLDPALDLPLAHLSLGQANLLESLQKGKDDLANVTTILKQAVDGLREVQTQEFIVRGLLALAKLYQVKKEFSKTQRDLNEAFTIATRGGMRLHEADCHLEYARLHLAMGEKDKARESLAKAEKMIAEMGYHRRDPEIHLIHAQLALTSGEKNAARESLTTAKELIEKMGMHRWDFEVEEIEEQFSKQ